MFALLITGLHGLYIIMHIVVPYGSHHSALLFIYLLKIVREYDKDS